MTPDVDFRFVVVTDGHWGSNRVDYGKWAEYDDWEDLHNAALNRIDKIHAEREIEVVVHCGDIVHDDHDLHQEVVDNFFNELPTDKWYPVYGNHDWSTEDEWEDVYGHGWQHTFKHGDYGFVIAETGSPAESTSRSAADADWIEAQLDEFESGGKDGVFAFQHVGPYEFDGLGIDMPDVREQYERDIVKGVFCGHNHGLNTTHRHVEGQPYIRCSRMGGIDNPGEKRIKEVGVRVVEVFEQS